MIHVHVTFKMGSESDADDDEKDDEQGEASVECEWTTVHSERKCEMKQARERERE